MAMFNQTLILQEEANYEKLTLAPEHNAMMEGIAKIVGPHIEISHIALKGFIWKSLKDMQVEHNVTTKEVAGMNPENRLKYTLIAFKNLEGYLHRLLRNKSDEGTITEAIDKGIEYYKQIFMNR